MVHYITERYYRPTRLLITGMGAAIILPWVILLGRNNLAAAEFQLPLSGSFERFGTIINAPWIVQFLLVWGFLLLIRRSFDWANDWLNDEEDDQLVWRTALLGLFIICLPIVNRILIYPYASAPLFAPTRGVLNALFNFTQGWRPDNTVIFFYLFCWEIGRAHV